jgi:hypothetical protein
VKAQQERRDHQRYGVQLRVHYRTSRKGVTARWAESSTVDMSSGGVSFRARHALPVGSHVELLIEWPARHDDMPMELHATGLIVRSNTYKTAVLITSRRFAVVEMAREIRATA